MPPYLLILITLTLSAFFSGMEIAFISSNRLKIEIDKKNKLFSSRIISIFTANPGHFITTLLLGNNIALVIYGIVMAHLLEPVFRFNLNISNEIVVLTLQTLFSTLLILVTGEFLPKTLFRIQPNLILNIFALPVFILYLILYPVTIITIWLTNFFLKYVFHSRVKIEKNKKQPVFAMIDIDHLVNETQMQTENQANEIAEMKIFQNTLEFSKLKVRDCMVPRTDITAIEVTSPLDMLREKVVTTGYSKILVFDDSIDNITGYVNSKDLFKHPDSIKAIQSPLFIIPETMQVNVLFNKLIKERKSIALVVDEYGGTSGIITLEDIMEEIFGEIEDEHDISEFIEKQISDTEFIFSARIEIDYLNEKYKLDIPESEEYDTLAGFIIYNYENIPKQNTRIIINPFQIRILKVSPTRIELIHLKKIMAR